MCTPYWPLDFPRMQTLRKLIDDHYRINMVLDNLPVTVYDLLDEVRPFLTVSPVCPNAVRKQ